MKDKDLKHLLDYDTLKEWGFKWGIYDTYDGEKIVTNYVAEFTHTDLFNFQSIMLIWLPHPNCNIIWQMSTMSEKKKYERILFQGVIRSKTALKHILKSVLIFKPE